MKQNFFNQATQNTEHTQPSNNMVNDSCLSVLYWFGGEGKFMT